MKVSIQEDITVINIHAPNNKAPTVHEVKTHRIKVKIVNSTVIVKYFNTPLSVMYRTTWHSINKQIENLNNTRILQNLRDMFRTL